MPYKDEDKNRKYQREWRRRQSVKDKEEVVKLLGGKCNKCGYCENINALQIDHIVPRRKVGGTEGENGTRMLRFIIRGKIDIENLQLLCANCHAIKTYEERDLLD